MEGRTVHVALCASVKKHAQSFDELKRTAVRCAEHYWTEHHITFHFMHLNYNKEHDVMELVHINDCNEESHDVTNTTTIDSNNKKLVKVEEIDVVVHKVATFGTERATIALRQWCHNVNQMKKAQWNAKKEEFLQETVHHGANYHAMPLIVIDPLDNVQELVSRRNLYAIMHRMLTSYSSSSSSSSSSPEQRIMTKVRIAHTLNWERTLQCHTNNHLPNTTCTHQDLHDAPLFSNELSSSCSRSSVQRWLANGVLYTNHMASVWWIAKPDQGTGPPFTHNLLIYNIQLDHINKAHDNDSNEWCGEHAVVENAVAPPLTIHKLLTNETNAFVLQEFYLNALPVIIKVYVADTTSLFIDVRSTRSLLTQVEQSMQCHINNNKNEENNEKSTQRESCCVSIDSQDKSLFTHNKTISKERTACDEDEEWVVQRECWLEYVNNAHSELHETIAKLVEMFAEEDKLKLSLYGFDVILVPHSLWSHECLFNSPQCKLQNRKDRDYYGCSNNNNNSPIASSNFFDSWTEEKLTTHYPFHLLFDKVTSEKYTPTPLLLSCEAVVIDMNYFPGYKGVAERASECMLDTIVKAVNA